MHAARLSRVFLYTTALPPPPPTSMNSEQQQQQQQRSAIPPAHKDNMIPQHLLLTSTILSLPSFIASTTPLYQQYKLSLREEIEHELHFLSNSDYGLPVGDIATSSNPSTCLSPLIEWSSEKINEMGHDTYQELYDNKILQMPYIYKHYIDKNEDEENFGNDGVQTAELIKRHEDTMAFWTEADIDNSLRTDDILLLSMHGSDIMDNEKLVPTLLHMFEFEDVDDIVKFASQVQNFVEKLPGGYNNPLLTMNAVATRALGEGSRNYKVAKDSLIIGDGVLQFLHESGLSSSGIDFVHGE